MSKRLERCRRWLRALLLSWWVFLPGPADALEPNEVPAPLKPWIRWALESEGVCPVVGDSANCVWPGVLELDLDDDGGRFRLQLTTDRHASVPLPGEGAHWPLEVNVPGQVAVVLQKAGTPSVSLPPGEHEVRGEFRWSALPETLPIPEKIALIQLRLRGKLVPSPRRDANRLWLKAKTVADAEPESLSLDVYRNLIDEVPFRVDTRLVLTVSGRAREVTLGNVLLEGSRPLLLDAKVPVRLEQGLLYAQVFPGKHELRFEAIYPSPTPTLERPARDSVAAAIPFWPEREVWVFTPNSQLRQVRISGSLGIDPEQTDLPSEWKQLAAYSVASGDGLMLDTERRGEPDPAPNRLNLEREMWLDLNGSAYTVRDTWSGSVNRDWRLDLSAGHLGRVVVGGEDQLVTKNPSTGLPGVELREGQLQMIAEWRTKGSVRELRAVGFSEDVQQLTTRIHVPPGFRILSAKGVDSISDTWLSSWDLFALFFVLIITLATARLLHPAFGVLALLTLVTSHEENGAPFVSWLVVLTGLALLKVIPRGWFRHLVVAFAGISSLALVLIVVSFGVEQVRTALFPQTAPSQADWFSEPASLDVMSLSNDSKEGGTGVRASAQSAAAPEPLQEKTRAKKARVQQQQDPEAVVQTGPGVPDWSWNTWSLEWSGPVHRDHEVKLYLLTPLGSTLAALLRTLLSFALSFVLLRFMLRHFRNPPPGRATAPDGRSTTAKAAAVAVVFFASFMATPARAEIPDQETLNQLRERLLTLPDCAPDCTSVPSMRVEARRTELRFVLQVHAGDHTSYQLPGPAANWVPSNVSVDGRRSKSLALGADGFIHLRLSPGRHRVEAFGPVGTEVVLSPGTKPHLVEVDAPEWDVEGLSEKGQIEGVLRLKRRLGEGEAAPEEHSTEASVQLPSWTHVERTINFGVTWTAHTELQRRSPKGSPVVLRIPLLPGERVTTPGIGQEKNEAIVTLARDDESAAFESTIFTAKQLELTAAEGRSFSERWVIRCSPVWHCDNAGIAPVSHTEGGHHQLDFRPWPGEKLLLSLTRPPPEAGRHTTLDSAELELHPGVRLLNAKLRVRVRTSTQGSVTVTLPEKSQVQELHVDGAPQPMAKTGSLLEVSLSPGAHDVYLTWQQPGGMRTRFEAPKVNLNGEVVNARVSIELPRERWLLWAGGPSWGPAVLFWGYLLLILLIAPVLGRLPGSRLKGWQWAILGLGLLQVPAVVLSIIVAWFFLFSLAPSWRPKQALLYNTGQVGLVLYSLVFLGCLFGAVYDGLLSTPDMEVAGAGSSNRLLRWYVDRTPGALPEPWVISTSLWVWRVAMLSWALWLAWNLLQWLRWAWQVFTSDGLWKKGARRPPPFPGGGMGGVPRETPSGPYGQYATPAGTPNLAPGVAPFPGATSHAPVRRETPPSGPTWSAEKTPIEPLIQLNAERERQERRERQGRQEQRGVALETSGRDAAFSTDDTVSHTVTGQHRERAIDAEPEERPTLPRFHDDARDNFQFSAFDFNQAVEAIDNMGASDVKQKPGDTGSSDETAPLPIKAVAAPPNRNRPAPAERDAAESSEPQKELTPPSRLGRAPAKPESGRGSSDSMEGMKFVGKGTPPGGFTMGTLSVTASSKKEKDAASPDADANEGSAPVETEKNNDEDVK